MTEPDSPDDVLPPQAQFSATLSGSGAIACGDQAKAAGDHGVVADEIHGPVVTGDHNVVVITYQGVALRIPAPADVQQHRARFYVRFDGIPH